MPKISVPGLRNTWRFARHTTGRNPLSVAESIAAWRGATAREQASTLSSRRFHSARSPHLPKPFERQFGKHLFSGGTLWRNRVTVGAQDRQQNKYSTMASDKQFLDGLTKMLEKNFVSSEEAKGLQEGTPEYNDALEKYLSRRMITDANDMERYEIDERYPQYNGKALAVLRPTSTEEAREMLEECNRKRRKVCIRAGGSGLVGGSTPSPDGTDVVMSDENLKEFELDEETGKLKIGAGWIVDVLNAKLEEMGSDWRYPTQIGSSGSCHVGGNVATDAIGPWQPTSKSVDSTTTITGTGEVIKGDTEAIGRQGYTGFIASIDMQLVRRPLQQVVSLMIPTDAEDINVVGDLFETAFGNGEQSYVYGLEGMSRFAFNLSLGERASPIKLDPSNTTDVLLLDIRSINAGTELEELGQLMLVACNKNACGLEVDELRAMYNDIKEKHPDVEQRYPNFQPALEEALALSRDPLQEVAPNLKHEDSWAIREGITGAAKKLGPVGATDIQVRDKRDLQKFIKDMVSRVSEMVFDGKKVGDMIQFVLFGHNGRGALHGNWFVKEEFARNMVKTKLAQLQNMIKDTIYEVLALPPYKGDPSHEHGQGRHTRKAYEKYADPEERRRLEALKQERDPNGTLNPAVNFGLSAEEKQSLAPEAQTR